jgi:integrase
MGNIRIRPETGRLYFDFFHKGIRCREQTTLEDTLVNRERMQKVLDRIDAEITLGSFDYNRYFPGSVNARKFAVPQAPDAPRRADGAPAAPLFREFANQWWTENEVRWRASSKDTLKATVHSRLVPKFGDRPIAAICKADILQYRAEVAKDPGRKGNETLSPKTINNILGVLKQILADASDRFGFVDPSARIQRLKVPRKDIEPFTLEEAKLILASVREDYRPYLTVRFFTGMRSGEANGLKWKYVDWNRRQILIRETFAHGRVDYTKNDGSQREIAINQIVWDALKAQEPLSKERGEYVFCTGNGNPIDAKNFANRVWAPLLRHLGIRVRRPYEMRHTCATLWLAAGENPEWIARQLGHTTTEMLFRVYSRFVPNLTRKDGSAFDRIVSAVMNGGPDSERGSMPEASHG